MIAFHTGFISDCEKDTVEELNGTYFFAGKSNLSVAQRLFMIFCENTASQLGIGAADFGAIVSGRNHLGIRGKFANATKGTSYASKARGNDKLW
ncbi:hypothetical protein EDC52_102584 [Biostraticola tofi]|uniref:Uncharacterized protein n=1 Tax=Biostraticola tofi TaxID=466109 RepID=A0A4R3Z0T7_9GAMM|nr:hypothetical protein EDC52_102584 [Biostraticola tofi]